MHCYKFSSLLQVLLLGSWISYSKAVVSNCTNESFSLFPKMAESDRRKCSYMVNMCDGFQSSNICSFVSTTDVSGVHGKAVIDMISTDNIRNEYKDSCKEAGGKFILCSFDIQLKKDERRILGVYQTLSLSVIGYPECVGMSSCNNTTDAAEYITHGLEYFFNASAYNFTVTDVSILDLFIEEPGWKPKPEHV
jgi:hypothetical protein